MKTNSNFRNVGFPTVRLRRLRRSPAIRDILQETRLSVKDLICPVFVKEGIEKPQTVESMPAIERIPISKLIKNIEAITDLGIRAILLFGIPSHKDDNATSAYDDQGIVQQSTDIIRKHFGDNIAILTDVCLCQYSSHGHCGIIKNQTVDNDNTIITLRKVAISHARVGADFVAPSAMMDGQVKAIREGLDNAGYSDTGIIGYSAKHASPLYAPFRDVAHSMPNFGDRRSYQMPTSNAREAIREIEFDINEGVDIIMIKPAIPYLDLIYQAKTTTTLPVCAYSVSGEYALIKAAADEGWIDENAVMSEFMVSIKRAGADMIITYYAMQMAKLLNEC
ncbi:MAG TPA: porphobilinogen synthase [Nitrososphaeraceae archaeon]|jgi:porphobilinogen synthase|nr:porphobilinogen synthase [Nitrososphaeraceae archaeon]